MTQLYAQPYDISAGGFYFETIDQYDERAAKSVNDYGQPVEEFEIQFIDGDNIDCELAKAWNLGFLERPQQIVRGKAAQFVYLHTLIFFLHQVLR